MMRSFANTISFLFHPLLMVTYGMAIALNFTYLSIYPVTVKLLIISGTALTTAIIPALFIYLLIRHGAASDIDLTNRKERALPYLIIITSLMICIYYLYKMHLPFWIISVMAGGCFALFVALCVNFMWKISAHGIGIGALLGSLMGVSRIQYLNPFWAFIILILIVGVVCTARIFLKRHTPMQTYAGVFLGFICTFMASISSYLFLFIK